jgi:hypothetical protein
MNYNEKYNENYNEKYNIFNVYCEYEDILFKTKQTSKKSKRNKISCYSSKHVRIQQSKICSKKLK